MTRIHEPTVGDVMDGPSGPSVMRSIAENMAAFDLERMTEPGLSTYGPPSKAGIARLTRFRRKYGQLPEVRG